MIDGKSHLSSAIAELKEAGVDDERVYYFQGMNGLRTLDLDGEEFGLLMMIAGVLLKGISREADEEMKTIKENKSNGRYLLAVLAETSKMKDSALEIMNHNDTYNL